MKVVVSGEVGWVGDGNRVRAVLRRIWDLSQELDEPLFLTHLNQGDGVDLRVDTWARREMTYQGEDNPRRVYLVEGVPELDGSQAHVLLDGHYDLIVVFLAPGTTVGTGKVWREADTPSGRLIRMALRTRTPLKLIIPDDRKED